MLTRVRQTLKLTERLQKYLHITHQQNPHIGNVNQTHVLLKYEFVPYQLNQLLLTNVNYYNVLLT